MTTLAEGQSTTPPEDSDTQLQLRLLIVFTALEMLLTILNSWMSSVTLYVFVRVPLFHPHMHRLILCAIVYLVVAQMFRFSLAAIEVAEFVKGHLPIPDTGVSMLLRGSTHDQFVLGTARTVFITAFFATLLTIVIERIYATRELGRYEKTINNRFFACCVLLQVASPPIVLVAFYFDCVPIVYAGGTLLASTVIGYIVLEVIGAFNRRRYRASLRNTTTYTLSERFQLQENVRSAELMKRVTAVIFVLNLTLGIVFLITYFWPTTAARRMTYVALNLVIVLYGYSMSIVGITSSPVWTARVVRIITTLFHRRIAHSPDDVIVEKAQRRTDIGKRVRTLDGKQMIFSVDEERELYFNQLQNGWK